MNKWLRLALNSFIGIIALNLVYALLFGGGSLTLAGLLVLAVKVLYLTMIVGLVLGIFAWVKDLKFF
ncbi:hypothetical protein Tfer_0742 [Thermincola ferriacetica]|uniref:Uncharacterized protein n=1 Tax=Thermincola ferriacetica TaxID=281456 RepID=A0A0L6W5B8_9FIRM|nr:hypothetical protein [Thermincola ferriacetica]KNZ70558.1 hypothetical protein Tfer_0742 [Thermincola ferriacetica]